MTLEFIRRSKESGMATALINGTDIYYEVHGQGPPLVFVHGGFGGLGTGLGGGTPDWVAAFERLFTVILYDRRSSGRSGFPKSPHSMDQFAGDIRELIRHLGHERVHVWGTSGGGPIALTFAFRYPEHTAKLVITESAPFLTKDDGVVSRLRERIAVLETQGEEAAYEARRLSGTVGLNLFAPSRPAQSAEEERARDENRAAIQAQLANVPREQRIAKYAGELRNYSAYVDWDGAAMLTELTLPVLIWHGTSDSIFPAPGWERLAGGKPNVVYRTLEGAEHGQVTPSPEVMQDIREFLLQT